MLILLQMSSNPLVDCPVQSEQLQVFRNLMVGSLLQLLLQQMTRNTMVDSPVLSVWLQMARNPKVTSPLQKLWPGTP